MPDVARRTWKGGVATLGFLAAVSVATLLIHAHVRHAEGAGSTLGAPFPPDDTAIPDDPVLREQLARAIDLRRREDFDRMLDARDPGELIEHATLTEANFDQRTLVLDYQDLGLGHWDLEERVLDSLAVFY